MNQHPDIVVTTNDYGNFALPWGSTVERILEQVQDQLPVPPVALIINNLNVRGLYFEFYSNATVDFVLPDSRLGHDLVQVTTGFLLSKAVFSLYPGKRLQIKHTISNGVYCEIPGLTITKEVLLALTAYVKDLIQRDIPIERHLVSGAEAEEIFLQQEQTDQLELVRYRIQDTVYLFKLDGFYAYTNLEMLPHTGLLNYCRLLPHAPGLIYLNLQDDDEFMEFWEQPQLAQIYKESAAWAETLQTPSIPALNHRVERDEIDDIIQINEALHEKKIAAISDTICARSDVKIVLIAGPSSSGKTTFAQRLSIQLRVNGRQASALSLDNYFRDRDLMICLPDGTMDFEALDALDLPQFNQDLNRLILGEKVLLPRYDFLLGKSVPEQIPMQLHSNSILVIEGIHGLNDALTSSIPPQNLFKIYVSAITQLNLDNSNRISTTDCRLIRRIVRDNRTRGHNALQTIRQWPSVRRGEDQYIFPFQENADVFFNSSLLYELVVLKPMVEPLLRGSRSDNVRESLEISRLLKFLQFINPVFGVKIPYNSIIREFIGESWLQV